MNKAAAGFIDGMKRYGYTEGENITCFMREEGEDLDSFVNKMMERKVDLFFSVTTPVTRRVKALTEKEDIPVVFIVNDPVSSGLVKSLQQPGGNLTGMQVSGSTPKALEWFKSLFHNARKIWVPVSFDTKAASQSFQLLKGAAKKLNIEVVHAEVSSLKELEGALASVPADVDAIFTSHSILINSNIELIAKKAVDMKLPLVSSGHEQYKKGALLSYGIGHYRAGVHVSRLADALLRGTKAADLPVESADFFLGLNLQTARSIDLFIPDHIIEQANFVVR